MCSRPTKPCELRFAVAAALATGDALEPRRGLRVPIRVPASVRHARATRPGEIPNLPWAVPSSRCPTRPSSGAALSVELPIGERLLHLEAVVAHRAAGARPARPRVPGRGGGLLGPSPLEAHLLEGFVRERVGLVPPLTFKPGPGPDDEAPVQDGSQSSRQADDPASWVREFLPLNRRRQQGPPLSEAEQARWEELRDLLEDCQGSVPPAPGERRRRSLRVHTHVKVLVTSHLAQELLLVHDLSENGLFLRTQRPTAPGSALQIEFHDKTRALE